MVTITINERTKAGKALLATAHLLAEHSNGIIFNDLKSSETPNNVTLNAINEARKGKIKRFSNVDDLLSDLNK